MRLPQPADLDKIVFKFVVDGEWLVSPDFPSEVDAEGNLNNVYTYPAEGKAFFHMMLSWRFANNIA